MTSTPTLTDSPTATSPSVTATAFLDALANHDVEAALALVHPEVSVTVYPLDVHGSTIEALRTILTELVTAFPDLLITRNRLITTGSVVTVLIKVEGTQAAAYAGAINQEKHLDVDQAWRLAVTDGAITQVSAYWCQQQLYRRLAVKRFDEIAIA
jgi:ketosteroid isomerase-like protein